VRTAADLARLRADLNKRTTKLTRDIRAFRKMWIAGDLPENGGRTLLDDLVSGSVEMQKSARSLLETTDAVNQRHRAKLSARLLDTERVEALLRSKTSSEFSRGVSYPGRKFLDPKMNTE